jgi:hypothetical protein
MSVPKRLFASMTALLVAFCLPAFAQLGLRKKPDEKKAETKNQMRYDKLKEYSLDKYQNDIDFKDEVDEGFEALLRDHSDRAYAKNTGVNSFIITVREDNWRLHQELYDNLLVQDHINRIGQRLVPQGSERLFAFKVTPEPTPLAETLSTGTIYVSTGLISLLDSEAQLAYVLAHEMAHVQLDHWKERVMLERGEAWYAGDQAKKAARFALIGSVAGAAVGGIAGRSVGTAAAGAGIGFAAGAIAGALLNRPLIVNWDKVQEDAADEMAFKAVLNAAYDVREVPNLYLTMQRATLKDTRVGLGFLGNRRRVEQRIEKSKALIANAYKAEIDLHLKTGFLSTSAEHRNLMAELKRDNGIMAYYRDMFELARTNLADAASIRDNDPAVHYFYGKVLKLVGRTEEDAKMARDEFFKAAKTDLRQQNFGSHLHLALMMAREKDMNKKQVADEFDAYVTNYARWNYQVATMKSFPPNLDSIYEYMTLFGDPGWRPKPPDVQEFAAYQNLSGIGPGNDGPAPVAAAPPPPPPAPVTPVAQKKALPPKKK